MSRVTENKYPRVADKKFWMVAALSAGASLSATAAGVHCRNRNGVEPCTEGYGAFKANEGIRFAISAVLFPGLGYGWKKQDLGRPGRSYWWLFPTGLAAFNIGSAIREFNRGCDGPRLPNGRCP